MALLPGASFCVILCSVNDTDPFSFLVCVCCLLADSAAAAIRPVFTSLREGHSRLSFTHSDKRLEQLETPTWTMAASSSGLVWATVYALAVKSYASSEFTDGDIASLNFNAQNHQIWTLNYECYCKCALFTSRADWKLSMKIHLGSGEMNIWEKHFHLKCLTLTWHINPLMSNKLKTLKLWYIGAIRSIIYIDFYALHVGKIIIRHCGLKM